MQVFSLPGHIIRSGKLASRIAAQSPDNEAAIRDAIIARWRQAIADGLTAEHAAKAVGVPRATLYRWERQPKPRSKRPKRIRIKTWPAALVEAVEALRLDHPMWGRAKIGPLVRREGFVASNATVGRIIAYLVGRGAVEPVPSLRRRKGAGARHWRRKHAVRLPKGQKPTRPGELVQVDTLSVNVRPDKAIKHFTAYDPVGRFTAAKAFSTATASCAKNFLDKLLTALPFAVSGIQVDAVPSSWPSSSRPAKTTAWPCSCCRPSDRSSTAPSSAPKAHGVTNSMPATTCRVASIASTSTSMPSPTSTTTTDPTAHLADVPQTSISPP